MEAIPISVENYKIGFIGAGKMAESIVKGVVKSSVLPPHRICISHSNPNRRIAFESMGVKLAPNNNAVVEETDVIIFSVKPQVVKDVALQLRPLFSEKKLLVSVAAGVKLKSLQEWTGHRRCIRVMPNTPSAVGEVVTVVSLGGTATDDDGELIAKLFGSVGKVWRADEKLFDATTGLSGSGPSYIHSAIEALADGGVAAGLPRELALGLASQTDLLRSRRKQKAEDDFSHRKKFGHIMRLLESSNPLICLHSEKIEEYFSKLTHTPDHPPYASMIERAITELNEQGGSSEETISKFIETKYEDLPISHTTHLIHHLQKLVTNGEIVRTSLNCYMLSFENSDSFPKKKKRHKHSRTSGRSGKNSRQRKFKGVKSKKEKNNEENEKWKHVYQKIFEEFEEKEQAEEQQIGSIGEHKQEGNAEMIEGQNEVQEVQLVLIREQIEADQDREGVEERDQLQKWQNQQQKELNLQESQVLSKQIDVTVEENYQAEDANQAEKNCEVMELQREEEDQEIEELYHKQQESKKLEEKNQESEVRDKPTQLPYKQIEEMVEQINSEIQHSGMNEEQKRFQEQKMEVCCQIFDLRNMLQQFLSKEKEDLAPLGAHNYNSSHKEALFGSSDLTKEEFVELSKMTHKVEGKLIDIISSMNWEVSENNNSMPKMGGQRELLGDHLLQTQNPCTGSETLLACSLQSKQPQQLENCGEVQASEYQPNIIPTSVNLRPDSKQVERNHETELPTQKRPSEVETIILEKLLEKQNKQIKLYNQKQAPRSQPKSMEISLSVPCDSPHDENVSAQLAIRRIEPVLEEEFLTTEPNIKFIGEAAISGPETEKSYPDVFMDLEQLPNSELCDQRKLPESQLVTSTLSIPLKLQDLGSQQPTTNNREERHKCKQPENLFEGWHMEDEATAVEVISQTQQQMVEQGPQVQLQPLSQKTFASQVDTATSVVKQCDQTEQMQKQQPPRQLRPRGRSSSESEPALTTFEADHDLTLTSLKSNLKQKSQPSISKRRQEQPRNHHGQKKWLKTELTTITADSIIASQQQANRRLQLRPPQVEGSSQTGSVMQKNSEESLPFQQKQPQPLRRGRPPKLKSDMNNAKRESMALEHQHIQKQSQCRGRGRPPKPKADTVS